MYDIIRIIKSLEGSGVLIDGVSEIVKHEIKEDGGFIDLLTETLCNSMLEICEMETVMRTGRGYDTNDMDKNLYFCSIF